MYKSVRVAAVLAMLLCSAYAWTQIDWSLLGNATPPSRTEQALNEGDAKLVSLTLGDTNVLTGRGSVSPGERVCISGIVQLDRLVWRRPGIGPQSFIRRVTKGERVNPSPRTPDNPVIVVEITCKSSLPPGETVIGRYASSPGIEGRREGEFAAEFPGVSRTGAYRVRVKLEAHGKDRRRAVVRGERLLHAFELAVTEGGS